MRRLAAFGAMLLALGITTPAQANSGIDSPENGVIQVGRGGAWLVRADDPLAAYYNPAALVTQTHAVGAGVHLMLRSHCFDRRDESGQRVSPGGNLAAPPDEVCADIAPFPNPHLAASFRIHERFALGLAVLGPHAAGSVTWPDAIVYADQYGETEHPSPQRYLMLEADNLMLFPTLSASFAITPDLSVGAGFVWGIASIDMASMTEATSQHDPPPYTDNYLRTDIRAQVTGLDGFVPGFVLSALWAPHRRFDMAGWFRWSDAVRTSLDLYAQANYYTAGGRVDHKAINNPANITDVSDAGRVRMPIPMEARLGFRYRHPRTNAKSQTWVTQQPGTVRDPLSQDVFDVELNLSWAHNSAVDIIEVRFEPNIRIEGTPSYAPLNGDVPHHWRDTVGVRLGGDYVVIPDLLSLRAGAFFESSAADPTYLNIDFHVAERVGWGGGGTVRLGPVDISLAYQHTWFADIDNGGQGGVYAISGDVSDELPTNNRSRQTINGGRASSSLNEVALGASYHF